MDNQLAGARILLVDDTESNLELLDLIFNAARATTFMADGALRALELAKEHGPDIDLVITDIRMPRMDGIQLTGKLREILGSHVPIILLTAERKTDEHLKMGLQAGANDYLTKPINEVELLARSASMVRLKRVWDENITLQRSLELKVIERTLEVEMTRDATMFGLAKLAEYRDPETGGHLERIQGYTRALAEQLHRSGPYRGRISASFIRYIYKASPLHDIGKVGIPDRILLKPGKLEPDEFEIMKQHSSIGGRTLHEAEEHLPEPSELLTMAKEIAFCHHEKWDGSGYPGGIKEEEIPLPARIMALADVYDALISRRIYKEAFPHEKTHGIILGMKGTHFDPVVVEAYQAVETGFQRIKESFKDAG